MYKRLINISKSQSFFLFGARGTGKSTFLDQMFPGDLAYKIDLLDLETHARLSSRPNSLKEELNRLNPRQEWIILDEIQRIPELLNLVHQQIESSPRKFALTGSSARKLRRGAANLLAGRAFVNYLYPLTHRELADDFDLDWTLRFGSLPRLFMFDTDSDAIKFLRAYAHTYLGEEIVAEQVVRNLPPFRRFLEVAAQSNGQIVNYSKIAADIHSQPRTVKSYFQVLEDTLVGSFLQPFHQSLRKRQRTAPKFYFFDLGVARALSHELENGLNPGTYAFGQSFEAFIINECIRLLAYRETDARLSYLKTKDGAEIDLIIERPHLPPALIEIKSSTQVREEEIRNLASLSTAFTNPQVVCLSLDPVPRKLGVVDVLPWKKGLEELGI